MKKVLLILVPVILIVALITIGNQSVVEPDPVENEVQEAKLSGLEVTASFTLQPFTQKLEKVDSFYVLTENKAIYALSYTNNFNAQFQENSDEVNTMPDSSAGEYHKLRLVNDSIMDHQYKSIIGMRELITNLKAPVKIIEGSYEGYLNGEKTVVVHTDAGIELLKKEYKAQMKLEMQHKAMTMISDHGMSILKGDSEDMGEVFAHKLVDGYRLERAVLPPSEIEFNGEKAQYKHIGKTEFTLVFTGDFRKREAETK